MAQSKNNTTDEPSHEQVEAQLDELGRKLERLRVRYEQYFLGVERNPPSFLRTDVVRIMRKLENLKLRNTMLKFRLRSIVQKFHSYSTYWNRTLRQMENGTYKRHRDRAKRRRDRRERREQSRSDAIDEANAARSEQQQEEGTRRVASIASAADDFLASIGQSIDVDYDDIDDDFDVGFGVRPDTGLNNSVDVFGAQREPSKPPSASKRAAPSSPPRRPAPPPPPPSRATRTRPPATPPAARRTSNDRTRRVYDEFLATREKLGMGAKKVGYDKFERQLARQAAQVKKKHRCKDVEFKVVVKDGKPFLKPVPTS